VIRVLGIISYPLFTINGHLKPEKLFKVATFGLLEYI